MGIGGLGFGELVVIFLVVAMLLAPILAAVDFLALFSGHEAPESGDLDKHIVVATDVACGCRERNGGIRRDDWRWVVARDFGRRGVLDRERRGR